MPVSAQECAASARIDADPVTTAAIVFAIATRTFEAKAMRTVVVLASEPARESSPNGPRRSSGRDGVFNLGSKRADDRQPLSHVSSHSVGPTRRGKAPQSDNDQGRDG